LDKEDNLYVRLTLYWEIKVKNKNPNNHRRVINKTRYVCEYVAAHPEVWFP
jgi:RNase P/RNase MRP subunit p30